MLLFLAKTWHNAMDSGHPSLVIALDFTGAFDHVWHRGLLAKLEQHDTLAIQDSINILGVEVNSKLSFDRHLESVARKASFRVTLLRQVRHLLDTEDLMKLYKVQVRPVMEYSPLTWINSAQSHLSLLDKVQRQAERLINDARNQTQRRQPDQRQAPAAAVALTVAKSAA